MSNRLFDCPTLELTNVVNPVVTTPLGTLTFDAEFDGILLGDLKPSSQYHLEHGGYLLNWTLDDVTAELLLCRPRIKLPEGMAVEDCWDVAAESSNAENIHVR